MKTAPIILGFLGILFVAVTAGPADPNPFTCTDASNANSGSCTTICQTITGSSSFTGCCVPDGAASKFCICCVMVDSAAAAATGMPAATSCANSWSSNKCACNCVKPNKSFNTCSAMRSMDWLLDYPGYANNTLEFNAVFGDFSF